MKQMKDGAHEELKDGLECGQQVSEMETGSTDSVSDSSEGKKAIESIIVTKTIKKTSFKKNYAYISDEVRLELLEAVRDKKEKIKHVAKRLGINYSSAKSICQVFQKEGRAKRIIIKKRGLREDSLNGMNKIVISEETRVMINLSKGPKLNEVNLSSNTKQEALPSQPLQMSFLRKTLENRDAPRLHLPQLAHININSFLKQSEASVFRQNEVSTVTLNPVAIFSNGHSAINAPQTSIQKIRLETAQLVSCPLPRVVIAPSNEAPNTNHYFINNGFQQNKMQNIHFQMNPAPANDQTIHFHLAPNMSVKPEIFINPPVQNLPFVAPTQPLQAYFIDNQQLNPKPTGNIIFPVIQTHNHAIGKGRFSLHM